MLGRDAGCDVVVPGNDVSRRHAQIELGEAGYVLVDTSTNGTFVNGTRIEGSRVLQRADVIRVGAGRVPVLCRRDDAADAGCSAAAGTARPDASRRRAPSTGSTTR